MSKKLHCSLMTWYFKIRTSQMAQWVKNAPAVQETRRCGFNPWIRTILWRRKKQPTSAFLPEKSHGQRTPAGYSPQGHKEIQLSTSTTHFKTMKIIHHLLDFAQTHVHWVGDAIQQSLPMLLPSPLPSVFLSIRVFSLMKSGKRSQLFASGDQSIGASTSASVLPMNIQGCFLLRLVWYPCSPRNSQESSPAPKFKNINSLVVRLLYGSSLTSVHNYWKKTVALTIQTFAGKVMSLLFNTPSRFVIAFLPVSESLLISWL